MVMQEEDSGNDLCEIFEIDFDTIINNVNHSELNEISTRWKDLKSVLEKIKKYFGLISVIGRSVLFLKAISGAKIIRKTIENEKIAFNEFDSAIDKLELYSNELEHKYEIQLKDNEIQSKDNEIQSYLEKLKSTESKHHLGSLFRFLFLIFIYV